MALTPGGGRSPSTQPPPSTPPPGPTRPPRDRRSPPLPSGQAAIASVLRWGVLIGGLVIITDLGTRAIEQRAGSPDLSSSLDVADLAINVVLFAFVGVAVVRETGLVYLGALAGALAGLVDGLVVAAMNSMVPVPGGPPSPETDIVWNLLLGTLFATVGALVNRLVGRRAGPGPR